MRRKRKDTVFINKRFYGLNDTKAKNIIWPLQALWLFLWILTSEPVCVPQVIVSYPVDFVMDKLF